MLWGTPYEYMCKENFCIFWENIEDRDPYWGDTRYLGRQNVVWVDLFLGILNEGDRPSKHRKLSIVLLAGYNVTMKAGSVHSNNKIAC